MPHTAGRPSLWYERRGSGAPLLLITGFGISGAVFEPVGQWQRAWYYPRPGEDMAAAVAREVKAARTTVGSTRQWAA